MKDTKPGVVLESAWKTQDKSLQKDIMDLWQRNFPDVNPDMFKKRLSEVVFVIRNKSGELVGISTAYRMYIKQLKNHLYAYRCFIDPKWRMAGLLSLLTVRTRDLLEEIHESDGPENERCIGMITIVENKDLIKHRTEAIWRASKMVYIGNTPKGYPIRVYYFNKALI